MTTDTFHVEQSHCDACEKAIRTALTRFDGVTEVHADEASDEFSVNYDPARTKPATIADRLNTAGYPVRD